MTYSNNMFFNRSGILQDSYSNLNNFVFMLKFVEKFKCKTAY
jgi:hypothetical protein